MEEIFFLYNSMEISIPCKQNEKLGPIIDRFCQKSRLSKKDIYFLFEKTRTTKKLLLFMISNLLK